VLTIDSVERLLPRDSASITEEGEQMNIYEAIGVFAIILTAGLGLSVLLKFAYDGARVNLPHLVSTKRVRSDV